MTATVAVAHYCEGAGHASRMLGVATALEARGMETIMAGGGPGRRFVELNGYDEPDIPTVDFVRGFQRPEYLELLWRTPRGAVGRLRGFHRWLRTVDPGAIVSDDPFATIAATRLGVPRFHIAHDPPEIYETRLERLGARVRAGLPRRCGSTLIQPRIWEGTPRIEGAIVVDPIAHAGQGDAPEVDVLLVPSAFTTDTSDLADAIETAGRSVTTVGGAGWTAVPSLFPHIDSAAAVVCSGYSTAMEAAVAGTPCVVVPATSEQRGIARALRSVRGFCHADGPASAVACLDEVEVPAPRPNGAERVAQLVDEALAHRGAGTPATTG